MATVYQRSKTYWGRFQHRGEEFRQSLETTSRSVALKRLSKWEREVKAATWGEGRGKTYDEAMNSFLDNHCPTLKPNSKMRYEQSAKFLTAFFSGMTLDEITSSKMAEFEAKRRLDGVTAPTIRRDLACLSSMFTHAIVDLEWAETNPVLAFLKRQKRRGRLKESPAKTRYLTVEEEKKLLAACMTDKDGKPIEGGQGLADCIAVAIDTGLRKEEQWTLAPAQVTIKYEKKTPVGGEVLVTKEIAKGKRERRVPLFPRSAQILARLPKHDAKGNAYKTVFVNAAGERFDRRIQGLKRAAGRAKIASLTWHDLRRTCGCRLLQDHRLSMEEVRDWLGHESIAQTEKAYAFLRADALQTAVQMSAQRIGFSKARKKESRKNVD